MQGKQGRGEDSWDKTASQRMAALNGTSKQRAIPKRPPGMSRVNEPPKTPRVGRLKRTEKEPPNLRRRLTIWGCAAVICAILACGGTYLAINYFNAVGTSSGAAVTVSDFLGSLQDKDYKKAYTNLGPAITIRLSPDQFAQQAKSDDQCFGPVKDYKIVDGSTIYQDSNRTYSYTYAITRANVKSSYQLRLTLQQDSNAGNVWKITDYGSKLGPADQSSTSCK